jgi:hypothetical protein
VEHKFFISHSSADRNFVVWLAAELVTLKIPVWYSDWEIKVGESIVEKINAALENMAGLVVVLSAASVQSVWVREELNAALSSKLSGRNLSIFPIRIDQVEVPPLISHRKYADFSSNRVAALGELAEAMVPATAVKQRIRDLKSECVPLLNRLKTIAYQPKPQDLDNPHLSDEIRTILLGVTSLLEHAVDERYSLELRQDRPDRHRPSSHPERYVYLVNRGFGLSDDRWGRLVELRAQYLHRLGYVGATMQGISRLRSLFPDVKGNRDAVERIAWLETIFDELIDGPKAKRSKENG